MSNYFNMHEIGRIIARHRKAHNMTQMELADLMNVSFQAVSNWERGQSMPDIAKLPELAECFSISIDELLGRNAPLLSSAAEGTLDSYLAAHDVQISEIAEAAPLLKPDQMEALEEKLLELPDVPADTPDGQPVLSDLLPYLSTDAVDQLMQRFLDAGDDAAMTSCLPFASMSYLDTLADAWDAQGKSLQPLLPFMSTAKVDSLAGAWDAQGKSLQPLFPFMSTEKFDSLADAWDAQGKSLQPLFPFMSTEKFDSLADTWDAQGKSLQPLLPYLSNEKLNQLLCDWVRKERAITPLLPFLSDDQISRLAEQAIR